MDQTAGSETVVIVGAGQAGAETAGALRQNQFQGRIVLVGEEAQLPYRRPPLSKAFLAGEASAESLLIRNADFHTKQSIEFIGSTRVKSIDPQAKTVALEDGSTLHYTKLVLATGGRPRRLTLPGGDQPNVHYIRTLADVMALQEDFLPGRKLVVIGGGYIGLEAAAVGIKLGLSVTVLEALPRVLARVAAPELSAFYEQAHRRRGVDVRTGVGIVGFGGQGRVESVQLRDGSSLPADLLIVGIGLIPNTELAEAADLDVDNGIVVDCHSQTSNADILAVGDVAQHDNHFFGRSMRIESVPSAQEQGRTAALTICGKPVAHSAVPWFWSDQYDLKLQMVGLSQGYDDVVIRGDVGTESFAAFYLRAGVVICAECVNRPKDFSVCKQLVSQRIRTSRESLGDEATDLKSLLLPSA